MTAFEFNAWLEGDGDRRDLDMTTRAWWQANIINGIRQVKRGTAPVRRERLYRSRQSPPEFDTVEEFTQYMRDHKRDED